METYTEIKPFVKNPDFQEQRKQSLLNLNSALIDKPIVGLIKDFAKINYCFTLQCCYGHFIYKDQHDPHNLDPLPSTYISGKIEYRIAYIAVCIDFGKDGKILFEKLKAIGALDENYVQFGCADWFWERQVNSFVLQVEPERYKHDDKINIFYEEALHLEKVRNKFFKKLKNV